MENATKTRCLVNFLQVWGHQDEITVYRDKCKPETVEYLDCLSSTTGLNVVDIEGGSSAGSWRIVQNEALKLPDKEVVYFVEDDYFHLPHSRQVLL
ncbi:MAG: hypothetical protein KY428_12305, partial [Bacteroidetes bacterium]|nr:hypothetical protein [Bacteroidota bacterium]